MIPERKLENKVLRFATWSETREFLMIMAFGGNRYSQGFGHACVRAYGRACMRIRETKYNLTRVVRKFRADRRLQLHSRRWTAHCLTSLLKTTNSGVSIRPALGTAYGRLFGTGCRKLFHRQSHFLSGLPGFTNFFFYFILRIITSCHYA